MIENGRLINKKEIRKQNVMLTFMKNVISASRKEKRKKEKKKQKRNAKERSTVLVYYYCKILSELKQDFFGTRLPVCPLVLIKTPVAQNYRKS